MPVLEFTIDPTMGELQMHIQGIAGPTCDDVAKLVEALVGQPAREQKTTEYYAPVQVQRRVKPGGKRE